MPKRYQFENEWYPVRTLGEESVYGGSADFTDAELADYDRIMEEFARWQKIIKDRFIAARREGLAKLHD